MDVQLYEQEKLSCRTTVRSSVVAGRHAEKFGWMIKFTPVGFVSKLACLTLQCCSPMPSSCCNHAPGTC